MIATGLVALLSHWRRQPVQLLMLLLGLSVATALWTGVQAINAEARQSYAQASDTVAGGGLASLVRADGEPIPIETFVALRRAGWMVSPVIEGEARFGAVRVQVVGIEPLTMPRDGQPVPIEGETGLTDFFSPDGLMYVSADLARRLEALETPPLRIVEDAPPDAAIMDIGLAARLLGQEGASRLVLASDQTEGRLPLSEIAPDLEQRAPQSATDLTQLTDSFHLNLTAFGLLSFVVGLFIVYASIGLAFEQRRPMFRTMRAVGISGRVLTGLLLGELLILALVAGLAGVALGYVIAALLLPGVAATLNGLYGAQAPGALSLSPVWWLTGVVISILGALAASAESLWRLARLSVLESAQPRSWARASQAGVRLQAGAGLVMLLASWLIATFGSGLIAGFAILGALLVGAALLLPLLMHAGVALCQALARGPMTQWFWADTRQQLPGLSIALMALMLALATNIGVGTMVSSFRLSFTGYLDQRLAAELYVRADSNEEADAMRAWFEPQADAVLPLWRIEAPLMGLPGDIVSAADHPTFRDHWPMLFAGPDPWGALARGEGVLVNEQLFRRNKLRIGDAIELPGGWSPTVVGVYSDYGNTAGQVIVGLTEMQRRYPNSDRSQFGVRVAPERTTELREQFQTAFEMGPNGVIDQAGIKQFSMDVFERTFIVTGALNVLTLGVAGFALFASLMSLAEMRLPQLAPVWALGLSRARLAQLELARTLALAALTFLAALPVGLLLAWVLLTVVNVEAFGWRLPLHFFPGEWAQLALLALLSAFLAALLPTRRLARTPPAELLKVFAHER